MKKLLIVGFMLLTAFTAMAQSRLISGAINDRDTKEVITQATVQLLKMDSTYVDGAITNEDGLFRVHAPENGKYLLKITSVGYKPVIKRIQIDEDKDLAMGRIVLGSDAVMLKGAVITAQAQKVVLKEDTFVYNSAAYRTPEGSTIEELVKRLPGAEVSDDGTIKINGKEVKKIRVNGKEFMTGDTKTALKNLPTSIVDKIKAYDEKSDLSRITGIDDGEEETVLDFGVKAGMNKGYIGNADLALGTKGRYAERLFGRYSDDDNQLMFFGSANNVNDMGFGGGRGGFWGMGRQGLNATKMLGLNYNYEKKNKLKIDISGRWNHSDGDAYSKTSSENFVSTKSSYGNSLSHNFSRSNSWDARMRLEWTPDTMTNILFRPSFSWKTNDGLGKSISASYSEDPYKYVTDPLNTEDIKKLASDSLMVNYQNSNSLSYSSNNNIRGMLQLNRKLNSRGRNVTLRLDGTYGKTDSKSLSIANAHLYLVKTALGLDSTYQTNRYNLTPTTNYSFSTQATYSEPLWRAAFLQFSYKFTYSYSKSDRSTFDFSNLGEGFFDAINPVYRGWDSYLSKLNNPLDSYLDDNLSRYSEYRNYLHDIDVMLRVINKNYNLNVGFLVQPQSSKYVQNYQGIHVDTVRTVTNFSPTLDFRYRFSRVSNLRINYRGTTSQPSMTDLLDITDDSDPLNIKKGNPGLKPSFTNTLRLFYNNYIEKRQQSLMSFVNFSTIRNSISNKVAYNESTGGRVMTPENINGNWNVSGAFMYNTAIDSAGIFNVNTFTNIGYNNNVGYLQLDSKSDSQKNTTKSLTLGERLATSYRNNWFELELDGSLNYTHARNLLQKQSDLDTWQFSYGGTVTATAPWGTSLSTDLHNQCRRGYNDNSMNTNELIWNAQLSQSFLKGSPLTVSLQFYDILRQQSTFSRTLTAMARTDTEYNSINSYAMLHVIYRLSIFGSKEAREKMTQGFGPGPDFRGGPFKGERPKGAPRPPRGGFGGPMM